MSVNGSRPIWVMLGALAVQIIYALTCHAASPPRDVPQWLTVSDAQLEQCTLVIQIGIAACIFLSIVLAIFHSLAHDITSAGATLLTGTWAALSLIFTWPELMLGYRGAPPPPGMGTPMPFATDFDYSAYLAQLLPQLAAPAAWATTAALTAAGAYALILAVHRIWVRTHANKITEGKTAQIKAGATHFRQAAFVAVIRSDPIDLHNNVTQEPERRDT